MASQPEKLVAVVVATFHVVAVALVVSASSLMCRVQLSQSRINAVFLGEKAVALDEDATSDMDPLLLELPYLRDPLLLLTKNAIFVGKVGTASVALGVKAHIIAPRNIRKLTGRPTR